MKLRVETSKEESLSEFLYFVLSVPDKAYILLKLKPQWRYGTCNKFQYYIKCKHVFAFAQPGSPNLRSIRVQGD